MKKTKTPVRPVVLTLSGSDSSGMAGMQMDVRTQTAFGIHTLSVITANTAQNNAGVLSVNPVESSVVQAQIQAASAIPFAAIKVGLLCHSEQAQIVKQKAELLSAPLVFDPVLAATSGDSLSQRSDNELSNNQSIAPRSLLEVIKDELLPSCTLITPNLDEAEQLTGIQIQTDYDMVTAAEALLELGAKAVLIKGGHFNSRWAQDLFMSHDKSFWLSNKRIGTVNTRGTGCALASSIASSLALGYSLYDAVVIGKMAINQGLRLGYSTELDYGPVSIQAFPDKQIDLPCLTQVTNFDFEKFHFPCCNQPKMGLYPIIDRAFWLKRLIPQGVTTVQLRIKDLTGEELENEISKAVDFAKKNDCRLFINDHWELAIKYGAYGVHLGQEDLDMADLSDIHEAGLRLGISTHCHYEVAKAHSFKPSYIACGPVFHTDTKSMPWIPHGLEGLNYWRQVLNYPLVAIGGINEERIPLVLKIKVDAIAMISAITLADDPEATAHKFVDLIDGLSL